MQVNTTHSRTPYWDWYVYCLSLVFPQAIEVENCIYLTSSQLTKELFILTSHQAYRFLLSTIWYPLIPPLQMYLGLLMWPWQLQLYAFSVWRLEVMRSSWIEKSPFKLGRRQNRTELKPGCEASAGRQREMENERCLSAAKTYITLSHICLRYTNQLYAEHRHKLPGGLTGHHAHWFSWGVKKGEI